MAISQVQSPAMEEQVRQAIASALTTQGAIVQTNAPGALVAETGSVGMAYLAGPFRGARKMPMEIKVAISAGEGGTDVRVEVTSRGTAGGMMSGGLLGANKQKKGEQFWMDAVLQAIPGPVPLVQ